MIIEKSAHVVVLRLGWYRDYVSLPKAYMTTIINISKNDGHHHQHKDWD